MPQLTEADVRAWLKAELLVPRETIETLARYAAMALAENEQQNLIASSTIPHFWNRHIRDSAQLLPLAPAGTWLDIGSGAGMPGLVIAILSDRHVVLVEQRTRRAEFLERAVRELGLSGRVSVQRSVRKVQPPVQVISARAVASLDELFSIGLPLSTPDTVWLLPKGRGAADDLASACASWQGDFRLVPSVTDDQAAIVVATAVGRKRAG